MLFSCLATFFISQSHFISDSINWCLVLYGSSIQTLRLNALKKYNYNVWEAI